MAPNPTAALFSTILTTRPNYCTSNTGPRRSSTGTCQSNTGTSQSNTGAFHHRLLCAVPREDRKSTRTIDEADEEEAEDEEEELRIEETHRMVWAWAVARQLLLMFESSAEVRLIEHDTPSHHNTIELLL